ncbi:MAG: hypothetical protein FJ096_15285 [Deltaproteobacteria bacterium]|nr:hypothetical protein [Deltaproteobacteria bacterium]
MGKSDTNELTGSTPARARRSAAVEAMKQAWLATFSGTRRDVTKPAVVAWSSLCADPGYRGRWIALEGVRYDDGQPVEGTVLDTDSDLATLCARVQRDDGVACAILFCEPSGSGVRRAGIG